MKTIGHRPHRPPRPRLRSRPCLPAGRLITFDTELRLICSKALKDHFAHAAVAQHFQTYEGQPLTIPAEAAGPKAVYLDWHREFAFRH